MSGKIEEPTVSIYEITSEVADTLNISFFVVGASARDLILKFAYGIYPIRATIDIDIGVQLAVWDDFHKLSNALIETGRFTKSEEAQRFLFNNIPVDIIPFGSIAAYSNQISWPPESEFSMNVSGYSEAYDNSIIVRLRSSPVLDIRVASLAGLIMLKLISFYDRSAGSGRDAKDIFFIIENYLYAGNEDRLFEENQDVIDEDNFSLSLAGARLLGRDIAKITNAETKKLVLQIINNETNANSQFRLVSQATEYSTDLDNFFERRLNQLNYLSRGLMEG